MTAWTGPGENPLALIYSVAVDQGLTRELENKLSEVFAWQDFDEKTFLDLDDLLAEIAGGVHIVARKSESGWYAKYDGADGSGDKYRHNQHVKRADGVVFVVEATPGDGVMIGERSRDRAYIMKYAFPRSPAQTKTKFVIHKSTVESSEFSFYEQRSMRFPCGETPLPKTTRSSNG